MKIALYFSFNRIEIENGVNMGIRMIKVSQTGAVKQHKRLYNVQTKRHLFVFVLSRKGRELRVVGAEGLEILGVHFSAL